MARPAIAARLKRLETRNRPPVRVHGSVARFTPEGKLTGIMPKGPCMIVTDHGDDVEWEADLIKQQRDLIASKTASIRARPPLRF